MADTFLAKGLGLPISRPATAGTNAQSVMSLFNGAGSGKILKVYRVWLENSQLVGTAAQGMIYLSRISADTAVKVCTTAASTTVTCAAPVSFFGGTNASYGSCIALGQAVSGTGTASGCQVTAVASATSLTVNQTGSVSAGTSLTFSGNWAITPVPYDTTATALPSQVTCQHNAPVTYTGTSTTLSCTTAASTTLTTAGSFYTTGVQVGSYVYGTNIATGTIVSAIASATSLTLSIAGLAGATNTLTFIAPDHFRRMPWSVKAPIIQTGTIDTVETFTNWCSLVDVGYPDTDIEPIVLREGFGISISNPTLTSTPPALAGTIDVFIEFTSE